MIYKFGLTLDSLDRLYEAVELHGNQKDDWTRSVFISNIFIFLVYSLMACAPNQFKLQVEGVHLLSCKTWCGHVR